LILKLLAPYLVVYFGMALLFGAFKGLAGAPLFGGLSVGLAYALLMFPITWGVVAYYALQAGGEE